MTTRDFDGRHVVITGGRGALGSAVVDALRAQGATCHVPAHDTVDLADEAAVAAYYAALPSLWASLHIAGGFAMAPLVDTSAAAFAAMMDQNARTCFLSCREAVRAMRRSGGGGGGGRIVNVGSMAGLTPAAGQVAYAVSKAAVHAITKAIAVETRAEGILVNAVLPSIIDTPANRKAMPDADFARWPKPAEIATIILALASPRNTDTTGELAPVGGSWGP